MLIREQSWHEGGPQASAFTVVEQQPAESGDQEGYSGSSQREGSEGGGASSAGRVGGGQRQPGRRAADVITDQVGCPANAPARRPAGQDTTRWKSVRTADSPRPTRTVATMSGGNSPCSTTPGVAANRAARAAGSPTGPS
jgi:hypothetical protein